MAKEPGRITRAWRTVKTRAASVRGWARKHFEPQRRHRALKLVAAVLATLLALRFLELLAGLRVVHDFLRAMAGGPFFGPIFFPEKPGGIEWKDRVQAAGVLLGLPVLFLLWHWRDSNVRAQIAVSRDEYENRRKDTNLKEFQEVQLRASGALDEKLPAEAREQLQIAALHQLRGFLRGEYGEAFRRPAFELLLAGHAAAMERIGHLQPAESRLPPVDRERLGILRDEAEFIVGERACDKDGKLFPLNGRCFDLINLSNRAIPASQSFKGCSFVGADLWYAGLKGVTLNAAHLEGANLSHANLEGANLSDARLTGAYLTKARLEGANLSDADLQGAALEGATFDGAVSRTANWSDLPESDRETHRQALIARGAIRSDLPSPARSPPDQAGDHP